MRYPVLSDIHSSRLHHAYAVEGDATTAKHIHQWIHETLPRAVVTPLSYQLFGIDDAHALAQLTQYATGDELRVFIITTDGFSREAQNALLKLLEEPVSGVHFFIIIPSFEPLLLTLQSRLHKLSVEQESSSIDNQTMFDVQLFMESTITDRLAMIEKLLKKTEAGDTSKSAITRTVLTELETYAAHHTGRVSVQGIQALQTVQKYYQLQGASHKILLEYLAVSM